MGACAPYEIYVVTASVIVGGKAACEKVLEELKEKGLLEGKIGIVSVNADTTSTVDRVDGSLICTIAQNPDVMGYAGTYAAVTAIKDGTVPPVFDFGCAQPGNVLLFQ